MQTVCMDTAVDADATLEDVIAQARGDSSACFKVVQDDAVVGRLDMTDLVRALVPAIPAAENGAGRPAA